MVGTQPKGDRFIPLARTGAWGQAAKDLHVNVHVWKEMMTMAKAKGIGADLWGCMEHNDVGAPLETESWSRATCSARPSAAHLLAIDHARG